MTYKGMGLIFVLALVLSARICFAETTAASFEDRHKDKDSVFLLYDVSIKLNEDWSITEHNHKIIKILKEEGQQYGEMSITYEKGRQLVSDIKVTTITPDGKKHPATKIQDMQVVDDSPMYSDMRAKVITQPEVNIGAVLDREYTVTSNYDMIKGQFWHADTIDMPSPTKEYSITVSIPKKLGIRYRQFKMAYKPEITEKNGFITYSWKVKGLAEDPKREEEYQPPPKTEDFINTFEFSSLASWSDLAKWYFERSEGAVKLTPEIKALAEKLVAGKSTVRDKTRAILEFVQDNFRYVSMSFGQNKLEPHPTDEVFRNKYGDCKDLSLLTKAMLSVVGVKSNLTLVRSETDISDPKDDLPYPLAFNHVLLWIDDPEGGYFADPLLKGYDIGEYPPNYQMAYAFVINPEGGRFARLPLFSEERNTTSKQQIQSIQPDGSVIYETVRNVYDLDDSVQMHAGWRASNKEERAEFNEKIDATISGGNGKVIERKFDDFDARYGRIVSSSKALRRDVYPPTDGMMIIDLGGFGRSDDGEFVLEKRTHAVFFPANTKHEEVTTFRAPKGFSISYVPQSFDLDNGFFRVKREIVQGEGEVTVKETASFRRAELAALEYPNIRKFYDELPGKTRQRIVITKDGKGK
ncbi:MAG: DUF3857 and transglutaminase domain-containing protein [Candidatus Omnitrophica bacterium]|nr:DUF3857 and transglutaminase domain-containing protein [Candidatus Omnitrophota bacterium]